MRVGSPCSPRLRQQAQSVRQQAQSMLKTFPVQRLLVWRFHGRVFDPMGPASPAPRRSRDHDSGQRGGDPLPVGVFHPLPAEFCDRRRQPPPVGPHSHVPRRPRPAARGAGRRERDRHVRCRRWLRRLQFGPRARRRSRRTLTDETELVNGSSYQPFNYSAGDPFPAPHRPRAAAVRSVFDGTAPYGIWRLYLVDDAAGHMGTLWSDGA